jgi:hypothetical protein
MALPDGRALRMVRDAGEYVTRLPKAEQAKQHWQTAAHELSAIGDGAHDNGYRLAGGSRYADISPVRIYHGAMRFALAHCPLNQPHLAPALRTFEGMYLVAFRNRLRADNPPLHGANDTGLRATHRTISFDVRQFPRGKTSARSS